VKTASTPMETQKPLLKDEDGEEVDVHIYRKGVGYNAVAPPPTGLFAPPTIDLSSSGLEEFQQPEFEGYGLRANKISDNEDEVESPVMVEKKTVVPTIPKVDIVRPKQQEKPVRKTISSGKSSAVAKLLSSVNISSGKIYTNSGKII
ncbi:hypothetical protein Tco_0660609, partial [Tanacetum coccineum]